MPEEKNDHPYRRPKDAATLLVVDKSGAKPRVLMGQRHLNSVFMPGKYVFPGGRVDAGDSRLKVPDTLDPDVEPKLLADMKGIATPRRAQALALAAIRETAEETGLLIGSRDNGGWRTKSPSWSPFVEHGLVPALSPLTFFLRAITPPGRSRRFDTRFFCTSAESIAYEIPNDNDELLNLHWLTFGQAMKLELPKITRVALVTLEAKLEQGRFPDPGDEIAYFFQRNRKFMRETL
jgi:8-oxo-dGTP pyrophosphatase MutT (NUDIX family)